MALFSLEWDECEGRCTKDGSVSSPSWSQFEAAIDRLDAEKWTVVVACGWGTTQMLIGGGKGKYAVSVSLSDDKVYNFRNCVHFDNEKITLKAGGQTGIYLSNQIADRSQVIHIARWFFDHNEPHPQYIWESHQ